MSNNKQKQQPNSFAWGKAAGMVFATGLPGILVIIANNKVFPDSTWLATGMTIATLGIAIIFAVASSFATPKVRKYVLIASALLAVELAANVAVHWVLARQVSGARQATTARHDEEDRAEARREAEAKRERELIAERRALAAETARQLKYEAIRNDSAARLGIRAPRGATVSAPPASAPVAEPTAEPTTAAMASQAAPHLTVEQVMQDYTGWLLAFAILDLLTSVVAFGVCALLWEWDLNHDGIADHLQKENPFPYEVGK